ncbi:MAG: MarR family transcriptional regulator [Methanothrix sp.]|jgi:Predicted transcriptional regulator|uniref:Helix-turn-helix, type 11 domain protein n=1 Tax=Methanothrix harundinacea TaxID=301375 RepID=A0A101FTU9_9EURY|nr:MAG: Helix-turn-helix, type 11 domain protein [Methanothrix harundinacea]MDD3709659.1 MarR family transcriptional regulator [Methanothrix sp.]MDI9400165.1 MarR family transcriptional regulator [Euryarchaeota archaeon]KUK96611.1 MAG: Helix-turn-helix, type 11 domain protein [Methanothrix harundinacea]MCP1392688.1 MarR family transcriptional regulator [Methanothrix harundinacea]
MVDVLQSKRDSSRFQILVEIAANQPNVRQKEVADRLGVTPQAISEYIKDLVADGLVISDGRMRYRITKEGVEWLLESAAELKRYARFVMEEIISHVSVWGAIADEDLEEGETVSLEMRDGLLYAGRREGESATGVTIAEARAGEDVGISNLKGLISLTEGKITVCKVPRVQMGGSRNVNLAALTNLISNGKMVGALGIESLVALRKVGREPDVFFGAKESAVESAFHGVSSVIICVDEQVPNLMGRLEAEGLKYELVDLTAS